MRIRRPLVALSVAALLAVPACGGGDDASLPPLTAPAAAAAVRPELPAPPARLCDALPGELVAAATGRSPVTVDGAGTQCSWRSPSADPDGDDVVLQGSFIDTRSFEVGRPAGGAQSVPGLGDDAYLVRATDAAPALYVRDGSVAFALWVTDPGAEGALAGLAREVLAG